MEKKQKKYQCDICDHKFSHKDDFKEHVQIVHGSMKRFKCDLCPKSYTRPEHLKFHVKVHHSEKRIVKCELCDKTFADKVHRNRHIKRIHNGRKQCECTTCGKVFVTPYNLQTHIKVEHRSTTYPCDFCDLALTTKWSKINHEKTAHFGVKRFKCEICEKGFSKAMDCKEHMWKQHGQGSPSHICHFCAKAFVSLFHFNIHFKQFHGKIDYECHICDMKFLHKCKLEIHMIQEHENQSIQGNGKDTMDKQEKDPSVHSSLVSAEYEQSFLKTKSEEGKNPINVQESNVKVDNNSQENQFAETESLAESVKMNPSNESYINEYLPKKVKKSSRKAESKCKCNFCGKLFKAIQDLEFHINQCHFQKQEFMAFCPYCKLKYIVKNDQDDHLNCETLKKLKKLPITITLQN